MGGFSWDDVVSSGSKSRQAAEEAFYGFGDFFRDLDKDRCTRLLSLMPQQPTLLACMFI